MKEYDFEIITNLQEDTEDNPEAFRYNNNTLKELLNKRATDGWRPLYPFVYVPVIWFEKE